MGAKILVNADGSFVYDPTGVAEFQTLDYGNYVRRFVYLRFERRNAGR